MNATTSTPSPATERPAEKLTGPRYWRSLDELTGQPEFKDWLHREFPQGASESQGVNRRHFLKIMGAGFAAAGLGMAGCRRPELTILTHQRQPEHQIPGLPTFYASAMPEGRDATPLIVETHGGRPTKVEGNEGYTPYGGNSGRYAQASVLDIYDPDRAQHHSSGGRTVTTESIYDSLRGVYQQFANVGGQGLAILADPSNSPTRLRLLAALRERLPNMTWAEYAPIDDANVRAGVELATGSALQPHYDFSKASRVLSIESDFLEGGNAHLANARKFMKRRDVKDVEDAPHMNRLYMAESRYTITGGVADHRLRIPASHAAAVAARVVAELVSGTRFADLAESLLSKATGLQGKDANSWVDTCAADLMQHRGDAVIIAGEHLAPEVHALVTLANELLNATAEDGPLSYVAPASSNAASIADVAAGMADGSIETLVVLGGNPAYDAPSGLNFAGLLEEMQDDPNREVIRYSLYFDETAVLANTHIAAAHYLESWGDARTADGTVVPVQPMILPLWDGLLELDVLARLGDLPEKDPYRNVLATYSELSGVSGAMLEHEFAGFLSTGMLDGTTYEAVSAAVDFSSLGRVVLQLLDTPAAVSASSVDLLVMSDPSVFDGRYLNNGWLQECPDPMTKLTWDNAISISPKFARELGFDPESLRLLAISARKTSQFLRGREVAPVATITVGDLTLTGPLHIQPGLDDYTLVLPLGYGRTNVGRIGEGSGTNFYPALKNEGAYVLSGATVTLSLDDTLNLAQTQEHWSMEGRAIIREANRELYEEDPAFAKHMGMEAHAPSNYGYTRDEETGEMRKREGLELLDQPRGGSLYNHPNFARDPHPTPRPERDANNPDYEPVPAAFHQWGMSIDLNQCTGCNACVVACQAENNIPIVGRDQVMRGREMHWIRLDRYYATGDTAANNNEIPEDPQISLMPLGCVHCENAPCEQVCPVNATVHDEQGLNVMAYNRCVGTRYCANNCPYKVRRFNFFDWTKRETSGYYEGPLTDSGMKETLKMQQNPDVTVRMRGVMEKCTYCQQRIEQAKIARKVAARDSSAIVVPDGAFKVACQQACPTDAIQFGNLLDENSKVSKAKKSKRDYAVLGYLNVRPRTTYLARVRNPNPAMPDYIAAPLSAIEYHGEVPEAHGHHGGYGDDHGHDHSHDTEHAETPAGNGH